MGGVLNCSVGVTRPAVDRSRAGQLENRVQVAMAIAEENSVEKVQKETYVPSTLAWWILRLLPGYGVQFVNFISGHGVYQILDKALCNGGNVSMSPGKISTKPKDGKVDLTKLPAAVRQTGLRQ